MCGWGAIVYIQHKNGHHNGQGDKDHGEQEILTHQWDHKRCGWDGLGNHQQKDSQRKQNRDAKSHFLATLRREVKDQHGEKGEEETGDDEVNGVKHGQPPDVERVSYVRVNLFTTVVLDIMLVARGIDNFPFAVFPKILHVHFRADDQEVNLSLVISPGTKFQGTVLMIKREEGDVHGTGTLEDGWWGPGYHTVVLQKSFGLAFHLEVANSTARKATRF